MASAFLEINSAATLDQISQAARDAATGLGVTAALARSIGIEAAQAAIFQQALTDETLTPAKAAHTIASVITNLGGTAETAASGAAYTAGFLSARTVLSSNAEAGADAIAGAAALAAMSATKIEGGDDNTAATAAGKAAADAVTASGHPEDSSAIALAAMKAARDAGGDQATVVATVGTAVSGYLASLNITIGDAAAAAGAAVTLAGGTAEQVRCLQHSFDSS